MKKSINAWSVPADVGFRQMFESVSAAGFDGIELNVDREGSSPHSLTMGTGKDVLSEISELSLEYGLRVSGISTSLGGKSGSDDFKEREFQRELLLKQIEFASVLGADGVLTVPGGMSESVSLLRAHENSLEFYFALKPQLEAAKVFVGVENVWNGFFASPFYMKSFIKELDCPYLGAYFDVGNVVEFSVPEYWIEVLGSLIKKVHVKDFKRSNGAFSGGWFVNLLEGNVNWKKVIKALKSAGFDGYLTAELEVIRLCPEILYNTTSKALDIIINL